MTFELLNLFIGKARSMDEYRVAVELGHALDVDRSFSHDLIKNAVAAAARRAVGEFPNTLMEVRLPGTAADVVAGTVPIEVKADPDAAIKGAAWKKQAYYASKSLGVDKVIFTNGVKFATVRVKSAGRVEQVDEAELDDVKLSSAAKVIRELVL